MVAGAVFAGLVLVIVTLGRTMAGPSTGSAVIVVRALAPEQVVVVAAEREGTVEATMTEAAVETAIEAPTETATESPTEEAPVPQPALPAPAAAQAAAAEPPAPVATAAPMAAPIAPTPTAGPPPVARVVYTAAEVRAFASQAGWPDPQLDEVVSVARCESGLVGSANSGGGPLGLMQIMPSWFASAGIDLGAWSDPVANLQVARFVYNHGISGGHDGWAAWSCRP